MGYKLLAILRALPAVALAKAGVVKWYLPAGKAGNGGLQPRHMAGRFPPPFYLLYMYYVYILKTGARHYIEYSSNLKRRFQEHRDGKVKSTKHFKPIRLCYYEAFEKKMLAMRREKELKEYGSAYRWLIERISGRS